jgi:flagellar biosynthesis protein FlhG
MARIITITSGKGGVGKTSISLNLSLALAAEGFKVCLFDADLGLANVNILTGLYPQKDLESVISGRAGLTDILIRDYQGIDIIPGSSGVERLADLTQSETGTLISAFLDLDAYDFFIFDTSAGISSQVLAFCMASHEIILVVTTEPTSLTDAYSMLKVLSKHGYDRPVKVIVNQVAAGKVAQKAYARLKQTVTRFLPARIEPLGIVASDKNVRASVIAQTPFFLLFPDTVASRCIAAIAEKLIKHHGKAGDIPLELFWDNCLSFLEKHSPRKNQKTRDHKTGNPDPNLGERLSRMEEKLSRLVKEMGDIRKLLETLVLKADRIADPPCPEPHKIILDFESWLAAKKG